MEAAYALADGGDSNGSRQGNQMWMNGAVAFVLLLKYEGTIFVKYIPYTTYLTIDDAESRFFRSDCNYIASSSSGISLNKSPTSP